MTQFTKYMHIERYPCSEVEGITDGKTYIFPKLDGTNSSLWVEVDGDKLDFCAGSRNNKLTEQWDNAGFYKTILSEYPDYYKVLIKHPELIIYGEFLVPHTIKDYEITAWNKFYVFDVLNTETQRWLSYEEYRDLLAPYGFNIIPPMKVVDRPILTTEYINDLLTNNHYLMIDDEHIGEGIVIKNYDYKNPYGRTTWAKIVNPTFKNNSRAKFKGLPDKGIYTEIIQKLLTPEALQHEYLKFIDEYGELRGELYPKFLGLTWNGWLEDNWKKIIKLAGKNDINFNTLHKDVVETIKVYYPI